VLENKLMTTSSMMASVGQAASIQDEVALVIANADSWLDAPNEHLAGRKPRDLIGTPDEGQLKDLVESIKHGAFS
jgi:uncharacterized protein (DUF2384 family)